MFLIFRELVHSEQSFLSTWQHDISVDALCGYGAENGSIDDPHQLVCVFFGGDVGNSVFLAFSNCFFFPIGT